MHALAEFKKALEDAGKTISDINVAVILFRKPDYSLKIILNIDGGGFTAADMASLSFNYDDNYGAQELFGKIVFNDNTWLSREEYDGREWWTYNSCPSYEKILESCTEYLNKDLIDKLKSEARRKEE